MISPHSKGSPVFEKEDVFKADVLGHFLMIHLYQIHVYGSVQEDISQKRNNE